MIRGRSVTRVATPPPPHHPTALSRPATPRICPSVAPFPFRGGDQGHVRMQSIQVQRQIGGRTLSIGTGTFAKLADGAVTVQYGDSVVFGAVVRANPREGIDFFPLQVDYRERRAAAGKFPGGFMKREGRPTTKEILTARLIDRPLRPLFPKGFMDEVQVHLNVLAFDGANDPDIFAGA